MIDAPSDVASPNNESSSQDIPAQEVQAPPEPKDLNENVVEAPTAYTGNTEVGIELTFVSSVTVSSLIAGVINTETLHV